MIFFQKPVPTYQGHALSPSTLNVAPHTLSRGDHRLRERAGAIATGAAAVGGHRARQIRRRARHQICASKIGMQAFARLQLMWFDQGAAVAATPPRKPSERTFAFIDA